MNGITRKKGERGGTVFERTEETKSFFGFCCVITFFFALGVMGLFVCFS